MAERPNIDALLAAPASAPVRDQLIAWVNATRNAIVRGDMMIGILSVEEASKIPLAYERAAQLGDEDAWAALAIWHANPQIGEPDMDAADRVLREAMRRGVRGASLAWVRLMWFYNRDEASQAQKAEAFQITSKLAQAGDPDSIHLLGLLTFQGFGTAASLEQAAALQMEAAELGNASAMFELHIHYAQGLGVPTDAAKALDLCRRAAESGHVRAMYNMGAMHATGRGVPKDMKQAISWYQRASDHGSVPALVGLATIYATGDGVPQNREQAALLLDEADYCGMDVSAVRERLGIPEV